jgi:hypothetical protein
MSQCRYCGSSAYGYCGSTRQKSTSTTPTVTIASFVEAQVMATAALARKKTPPWTRKGLSLLR